MSYLSDKNERLAINKSLQDKGVVILDIDNTYIEQGVEIGEGTTIYPNCFISGKTVIGGKCVIGPNTQLKDMEIGDACEIVHSVCLESSIANDTHVGPFAYIRPHCSIGSHCKVGDFVELKNSTFGDRSKASHLSYIGDSDVGEDVNVGCGVVTVNYDGKNKSRATVENKVFIGCNSNLVSPVTIEAGAYIAAGSTITDHVPANNLSIARARQINKDNWVDKRKR